MIIVLFVFFIATTTTTNHHIFVLPKTILIGCLHCRQSFIPSFLRWRRLVRRWRLVGCPSSLAAVLSFIVSAAAGSLSAVAVVVGMSAAVIHCRLSRLSLLVAVVRGCAVVVGCSSSSAAAVLHRRLSAVLDRR